MAEVYSDEVRPRRPPETVSPRSPSFSECKKKSRSTAMLDVPPASSLERMSLELRAGYRHLAAA